MVPESVALPQPRMLGESHADCDDLEAYRGRNLEICNLNDTLHGLGGLLIEPSSILPHSGLVRSVPCRRISEG